MSFNVQLRKNGPYIVEGQFSLDDGQLQSGQRVALCRCGESKNKPLCDGAHKQVSFESEDCGQAGKTQNCNNEKDQEQPDTAGSVQTTKNGPYILMGDVEIATADGEKIGTGVRVALCRCGQSKNKPFCDSSHQEVGFKAP